MSNGRRPAPEQASPYTTGLKATAGAVTVLAVVALLIAARLALVLVIISFVLALGFQPARKWLERRGLSRRWTVAVIILVEAVVAAFLAVVVAPTVVREFVDLVEQAPQLLREQSPDSLLGGLDERFDLASRVESFRARLPDITASLLAEVTTLIFGLVTIVVLTTYFTAGMPGIQRAVARLLWREDREDFETIIDTSTERVGGYIRGNLLISVIAGVTSFVGLLLIGVPSAAALAFFVAITDLIPVVGAIAGAGTAILVAAFAGTAQMIATAIFFLVYQQVENYVIQPRVMRKAIDMSAATVIVAVLIGGTLLGITGALLALPMAAIIKVVIDNLYLEERVETVRKEDGRRASPRQKGK